MKKVKEMKGKLKQYLATLMIVTLVGANMSLPSLAAAVKTQDYELEMDKKAVTMFVGNEETLTVSLAIASPGEATPGETLRATPDIPASPGEATPPDLNEVVWTSSSNNVTVDGTGTTAKITAVAPGPATVTASLGDLKAVCKVKVSSKPQMTAKLSRSSIDYHESSILTVTANGLNLEDGDTFKPVFEFDEYSLDFEETDDSDNESNERSFEFKPVNGYFGTQSIKISAKINGNEVTDTVELTVKKPTLKLTGPTTLEVKGNEPVEITASSNCEDFNQFEWWVEGDAVTMVSPSDESSASVKITPVMAGSAVVHVKASYNSAISPGRSDPKVSVPVEAKITLDVKDSRHFSVKFDDEKDAKKGYITLDINKEAPILTKSFTVVDDFNLGFDAYIMNPEEEEYMDVKIDGNKVIVTTTAETTGTAAIEVYPNAVSAAPITILIDIISSANPVIVGDSDIVTEMENGAVKTPTLNTDNLTDEQKADAEEKHTIQVAGIRASIIEALSNSLPVFASDKEKAIISRLASIFGSVEAGKSVRVYPKQTLSNVLMDSVVTVDPVTKEVSVKTIIQEMYFNIDLLMQGLDAAGNEIGDEADLGAMMGEKNKEEITFPIPLPTTGISKTARYAKVTHGGEVSYSRFMEEGGIRYVTISTTHFSTFKLEFVDSIPTVTPPSGGGSSSGGGGGRGYSSTAAKWIQDSMGWRYQASDGTWPVNTWKSLLWNNTMQWYRFNPQGYMVSGWFTDVDGNKYFMHNIPDGQQGHMYTDWHQIEGKWYYFRTNVGGPQGSLFTNGVTPDGYTVDENGVSAGYPNIK